MTMIAETSGEIVAQDVSERLQDSVDQLAGRLIRAAHALVESDHDRDAVAAKLDVVLEAHLGELVETIMDLRR